MRPAYNGDVIALAALSAAGVNMGDSALVRRALAAGEVAIVKRADREAGKPAAERSGRSMVCC